MDDKVDLKQYVEAIRKKHASMGEVGMSQGMGEVGACLVLIDRLRAEIAELERLRKADRGLFLRSLAVSVERIAELEAELADARAGDEDKRQRRLRRIMDDEQGKRIAELEAKRDWAKAEVEKLQDERDELAAELGQLSATYDRLVMETDTDRLDKLAAVVEAAHGYKRALAAYHNSNRSHEGGANKALNRAREAMLAALDAQTEGGKDGE